MAKKRVHEIAKEQGLTSKELLAKLNAAGIEAKAAASSVEESVALEVLGNGAGAAPAEPKQEPKAKAEQQEPKQPPAEGAPGGDGHARQRPTRSSLAGERAPGAGAGGVRRVVIDSQAS